MVKPKSPQTKARRSAPKKPPDPPVIDLSDPEERKRMAQFSDVLRLRLQAYRQEQDKKESDNARS